MHHHYNAASLSRRELLMRSGMGLGALGLAGLFAEGGGLGGAEGAGPRAPRAPAPAGEG